MNIVVGGRDAVLLLPGSRNEGCWQERTQARLRAKRTVHALLKKNGWVKGEGGQSCISK